MIHPPPWNTPHAEMAAALGRCTLTGLDMAEVLVRWISA